MRPPGALLLTPVFLPKVWAGPGLPPPWAQLLKAPPGTGEVWLASARHHVTPVARGELRGMGLDEAVSRWPEWIMGPEATGQFPILAKLLNVGQWLSVQVHPGDEQAQELEGEPWGKNELWHVLAAQPEAQIVLGLAPGLDRQTLAQAAEQESWDQVLNRVPARPGDTFLITAGTVHTPGPGLLLFELQQASDVTYRLYDWQRPGLDGRPRQLHLDKALRVLDPGGARAAHQLQTLARDGGSLVLLGEDSHFALLAVQASRVYRPLYQGPRLRLLFILQGEGRLSWSGGQADEELIPGQCWLLPAGLREVEIDPGPDGLRLLESVATGTQDQ